VCVKKQNKKPSNNDKTNTEKNLFACAQMCMCVRARMLVCVLCPCAINSLKLYHSK
jgi:hypothetical protein